MNKDPQSTSSKPNRLMLKALAAGAAGYFALTGCSIESPHPIDETKAHNLYQVKSGDTLGKIAQEAEPNRPGDLEQDLVKTIQRDAAEHGVRLDDNQAETIMPGQEVVLPSDSNIGMPIEVIPGVK